MFTKDRIIAAKAAIADIVRDYTGNIEAATIMSSYLLYKASESKIQVTYDGIIKGALFESENLINATKTLIASEAWPALYELTKRLPRDLFKEVALLNAEDRESTPDSIIHLVSCILDIQPGDSVADLCCGTGNFLIYTEKKQPAGHYYGCEINAMSSDIARIRAELSGGNIEIEGFDVFRLPEKGRKYNKIFCDHPFGLRAKNINYLTEMLNQQPTVSRVSSGDWLFNYLVTELLEDDGKAAVIMPEGGLFNTLDQEIRSWFIGNGFIEAVIQLTGGLLKYSSIGLNLVILSRGNEGVRFVDARDIHQKERRYNNLSEKDIDTIVELSQLDSKRSVFVPNDDLIKNDALLNVGRYMPVEPSLIDNLSSMNISLGEVADIFRGAPISAANLDQITTPDETDYQFLMLTNIKNGVIQNDLPYITSIDAKDEKYCIEKNDLIISKNNAPYKVAVIRDTKGKKVMANGNLFILRIKNEKVQPYYLQAFFQSVHGQMLLDNVSMGTTLKSISIDALRKLMIPIPDMNIQKRVAEEFLSKQDEMLLLEHRLEIVKNDLSTVFERVITEE